jgi:hypothetical protein
MPSPKQIVNKQDSKQSTDNWFSAWNHVLPEDGTLTVKADGGMYVTFICHRSVHLVI